MFGSTVKTISGVAGAIAALILAAMCCAVLYDVTMRYVFNAPTVWTVEYTGYAVAWLGLLGAADVLRRDQHVKIELLVNRLSPTLRRRLIQFAYLVVFLTAANLTYSGIAWVIETVRLSEISDTVLQTPQAYVRAAFPLGMLLVVLVAGARMVAPESTDAGDR